MKHQFTYKIFLVLTVFVAAFVFTACDSGTTPANQETTVPTSQETTAPSSQETTTIETTEDTSDNDEMQEEVKDEEETMSEEKVFTLEELSKYDGKDGNPAYVAVDGVVYDVTDKPLWAGGTHNGNFAGRDLSEEILKSPHGKAKLEELPIVGTLAEE